MARSLFLITLVVVLFVALTQAQGVSKTGKKDGNALYKAARTLKPGNYVFTSSSGQHLAFISKNNIVEPQKSGQIKWQIKKHKKTKYFSAHGRNNANLEKCISTRWTVGNGKGGYPDAAVLWQCEVDTKKSSNHGGYDPIYPPKQLWLAVPHKKYFKIVSASHLYDMIPRCISHDKISGGTKLKECKLDSDDDDLLWKIQRK